MKRETISQALNLLDERHISDTAVFAPAFVQESPERMSSMNAKKKHTPRQIVSIALAAALVLALALTAYAISSGGIRELWPKTNARHEEFPEQAADYIQTQDTSRKSNDWNCRIVESYCDDSKLILTAVVTCGDAFLPVPTDADPAEPASAYGFEGAGTLGEYAKEEGKELLLLGIGVIDEAVGSISGSEHFEILSDSELQIIYETEKSKRFDELDTECRVAAQHEDGELEILYLPLHLTAGSAKLVSSYCPIDPDAVPGLRLGEATLTETPLGLTLQAEKTIIDQEAEQNIMKFDCAEIDFDRHQGAMGFTAEDGTEYLRLTMGEGEAPNRLTLRFYDWDKELIGEVVFTR